MTRPRFIGGALLAAVAAGPVFVLTMLAPLIRVPAALGGMLASLPIILVAAAVCGFVVALLPAVAAAAALASLGRSRAWARHPLAWAGAGVVVGMTIGIAFTALAGGERRLTVLTAAASPFAVTGLLCASLARWRTRWPGAVLSPPLPLTATS